MTSTIITIPATITSSSSSMLNNNKRSKSARRRGQKSNNHQHRLLLLPNNDRIYQRQRLCCCECFYSYSSTVSSTIVIEVSKTISGMILSSLFGDYLERKTKLGSKIGGAINTMIIASLMFSVIPGMTTEYSAIAFDFIWDYLMPIGVILALFTIKLSDFAESKDVLIGFSIASIGSILGTLFSFAMFKKTLGVFGSKIAACLCASYIGGTLNFAATAKALELLSQSSVSLIAAAMTVDNILMAVLLSALMIIPCSNPSTGETTIKSTPSLSTTSPLKTNFIAISVALITLKLSSVLCEVFAIQNFNLAVTCLLAPLIGMLANQRTQIDFSGTKAISNKIMLLFFACIGAGANVRSLDGTTSLSLFAFVAVLLFVQLLSSLVLGKIFRIPRYAILIGLNASAGGPATAFAMAQQKGWNRALQPSLLSGSIGYAVGTLVGTLINRVLIQI
jgi:uncharacterized membrane protein